MAEPVAELDNVREEELEERAPSKAAAVHERISRQGEKELARDFFALFWSAIAAGMTMSMSFLGRALLQAYLPDAPAAFLIEAAGYALGFVFVISAGQQLFTENTITPVLPVMRNFSLHSLGRLLRLWGIVLLGNLVGGFIAAAVFAWLPMFTPEVDKALLEIGLHLGQVPLATTFGTAVLAGWLIATLVWMLHAIEQNKLAMIVIVTWLMGVAGVAHVVVGTIEVMYVILLGQAQVWPSLVGVVLPALVGNVLGGTFIFALMSHAQVKADVE
ncbi:formate/nitrite transporter family protein [Pseudoxanthomonas winnipegensis]|uniref:formate/nitrite transporter family protein n=1 Tax=Pseudoxanthomonas winnipegensis TaxID=2480810 RepID=UPI003F8711BF